MPRDTAITLDDHSTAFIDARMRGGGYGSASDAIGAGLRLMEEQDAKLERLRAEIAKGDASGPGRPFDWDAFKARKHQEWRAKRRDAS